MIIEAAALETPDSNLGGEDRLYVEETGKDVGL
jgi:hypothetical protein